MVSPTLRRSSKRHDPAEFRIRSIRRIPMTYCSAWIQNSPMSSCSNSTNNRERISSSTGPAFSTELFWNTTSLIPCVPTRFRWLRVPAPTSSRHIRILNTSASPKWSGSKLEPWFLRNARKSSPRGGAERRHAAPWRFRLPRLGSGPAMLVTQLRSPPRRTGDPGRPQND